MRIVKYACLLSVFAALAAPAATINFRSGDGLNESNDNTGANVLIDPHPVWAVASAGGQWISHMASGFNGVVIASDPNTPYATFTEEFVLPSGPFTGAIDVWADDTAAVYLNGVLLVDRNLNLGPACTTSPISCVAELGGHYIFSSPLLLTGRNVLAIAAFQIGDDTAGLLYSGAISPAPEPVSAALLGVSLAGLLLLRNRRR